MGATCRAWMPDSLSAAASRVGARLSVVCPRRGVVTEGSRRMASPGTRASQVLVGAWDSRAAPSLAWGRVGDALVAVEATGGEVPGLALAHELVRSGAPLQDGRMSELVLHLLARAQQRDLTARLVDVGWRLRGGYSVVVASDTTLWALCDPYGLHALHLGFVGEDAVVATDPDLLAEAGCAAVRPLVPGELVVLTPGAAPKGLTPLPRREPRRCGMARLRFDAPQSAWSLRNALGQALAAHLPVVADLVIAADAASLPVAVGYAGRGRALPWPEDLASYGPLLADAQVVLVAAAGAEPVTLEQRRQDVLEQGAAAVHIRVAGPSARSCYYGHLTAEGAADGAAYLPLEVVARALGEGHCAACLGASWPVLPEDAGQLGLFGAAAEGHTSTRPR